MSLIMVDKNNKAHLVNTCQDSEKTNYKTRRAYFSSPPTRFDYGKTMSLFHDFGMDIRNITIPKFKTKNQLYNWRTNRIKEHLSNE